MSRSNLVVAVVVAMAAILGAGCFSPFAGCDDNQGFASWRQTGVYQRFPSAGQRAAYNVEWDDETGQRKAWQASENPASTIYAYPNGTVTFRVSVQGTNPKALPDENFYAHVQGTYTELGLGAAPSKDQVGMIKWRLLRCG
jgi:hypothetical protein